MLLPKWKTFWTIFYYLFTLESFFLQTKNLYSPFAEKQASFSALKFDEENYLTRTVKVLCIVYCY